MVITSVDRVQLLLYGNQNSQIADISCYGVQIEQGSYATSYIPTEGSSVTRNQDVCNNGGSLASINSTEGTLYAEAKVKTDTIFAANCIAVSDGTDANRLSIIMYGNINAIRASMNVGGVTQFDFNLPSGYIQEQYYKIAVSYKVNDCKIFINGTKISTDTSATMPLLGTFDRLNFDLGQGLYDFYGNTKALAVWKEALSDQELAELTYPTPTFPTFSLDFNTIAEQFTFARGSEATYVDAQGLIQSTASNNAPRLDYSTGAEAFLLEPQSTNLITQSEDFSQWIDDTDTSITSNAIISPDGTQNADKLIAGNSVARQAIKFNLNVSGDIVMSVFAKKGEYSVLQFSDAINGAYFVNFDIENGTIGASNTIVGSIQDYGNGWYRCVGVYNSANPIISFRISIAENSTDGRLINFSGNNSDGLYIWGAQLEQQSYATSYIPSAGSQTTRNQETCNNATPEINSEEGVLYFEGSALSNVNDRRIAISDGTMSNYVSIGYSRFTGNIVAEIFSNGVSQNPNWGATGVTQVNNNKFALSWGNGTMKFYVNGTQTLSETVTSPIGLNVLDFTAGNGALLMYANTKDLQVYTKALSDAELIKLTTI